MKLYFAYGANLNLAGMNYRCPNAKPIKKLILQNWELGFSGVATIKPKLGSHVHGALWLLTKKCEDSLDVFEGYPSLYRKIWLNIFLCFILAFILMQDILLWNSSYVCSEMPDFEKFFN